MWVSQSLWAINQIKKNDLSHSVVNMFGMISKDDQ